MATTVCSPADVLKVSPVFLSTGSHLTSVGVQSRIMNASGPGSNVRTFLMLLKTTAFNVIFPVHNQCHQVLVEERGRHVHVQRLGSRMDASAAYDDIDLFDAGATEERR